MQNRYKRITLDEIYRILMRTIDEEINIKYPVEVKALKNGVGIRLMSVKENISLCFYPDHPTSQVSVTRKGMRYIFSKRDLKLKRSTFEDMIHHFMQDDRLFGVTRMIELYLIEIIKLDHPDIIESVYLS